MGDERPSTSGGLTSKKQANKDFNIDKRISRDDFYVNSRIYGETRSTKAFTPERGRGATPKARRRSRSSERFALATMVRMAPESIEHQTHGDIGMALGSPTHPPVTWNNWNPNAMRSTQDSPAPDVRPGVRSSSVGTAELPHQRKPGKWKLFGVFGRKHSEPAVTAVSISDPNGLEGANHPEDQMASSTRSTQEASTSPNRSTTTTSRKNPKYKPIVVRSQTMPLEPHGWDGKSPERKKSTGEANVGRIATAIEGGSTAASGSTGSLLNVEIPEFRMERYSVMFNSVLNSHPTLLTRRQANVPRLRSIEDGVELEEEEKRPEMVRRATSPQPTKSPGLALFPVDRKQIRTTSHKVSPLTRSNTSPALLPSPSKSSFDRPTPRSRRPSGDQLHPHAHTPQGRHHYYKSPEKSKPAGASSTPEQRIPKSGVAHKFSHFNNDESQLLLESPTEDEELFKPHALKPAPHYVVPSPKWQMISPPQKTPSTASSSNTTGSSYRSKPSPVSSSRTQITPYSQDFDEHLLDNATTPSNGLKLTPVELSIARQITLSRQQRSLLQPLRTAFSPSPDHAAFDSGNSARKTPPTARVSPGTTAPRPSPDVSGMALAQNGRIAETKTSTPTLIHPPGTPDNEKFAAQHRRSEMVIFEGE